MYLGPIGPKRRCPRCQAPFPEARPNARWCSCCLAPLAPLPAERLVREAITPHDSRESVLRDVDVLARPFSFYVLCPFVLGAALFGIAYFSSIAAVFLWFVGAHWGSGTTFEAGYGGAMMGEPWSWFLFAGVIAMCAGLAAEMLNGLDGLWLRVKLARLKRRGEL